MGAKKNFVIDTNVILHDYNCLKNFQENDIYLPIVVLEELDKFKKGNEQINFNAREFVRELDLITDDNLFTKGRHWERAWAVCLWWQAWWTLPEYVIPFPNASPTIRFCR